ncbi:homodimeric dihydroxyacetone kinase [Rhizobium sp. PP-F2F-G48]|uniref:dihydroxyacetone kinase subunit DhaK n=1 Tax=Rhizobium sp. PP-F2F-G48 TaxID=2135651 RepID=UPI0010E68A94|nr:dihydroxyacetone kinase subunit DhaK [Rhizobium sp. PP-F2F-G48]TCM52652.1 homodimeric dihydroxyacetone kinase [Rhizobium sp. PP-F2F-G48]
MKCFMNARENLVTEAIEGLLISSAGEALVRLDGFPEIKVVLRRDWQKRQVAVISGGGSGHEPAHAGFVGEGMLTAAVCGEVFASPSVDAVLAAIVAVTGDPGCLLIVKNYTGDRLNFGLAAERAKALGLKVEMVIVSDDIALPDFPNPRGIAGTLFVHKIAGALASEGASLEAVHAAARDAAANVRSLGLALTNCNIPGAPGYHTHLAEDAVELGLGIHGEPGAETRPFAPADELVAIVADRIDARLGAKDRVALLVNSLGGTSPLEMAIVTSALRKTRLFARVDAVLGPAPLMTAIDMRGFSLSVLVLNRERLRAIQAETSVATWPRLNARPDAAARIIATPELARTTVAPSDDPAVHAFLLAATASLASHAADVDALDAKVGDGDTGSTLALAAGAISGHLDQLPLRDGASLLQSIGERLLRSAGGSSGVLLSILFTSAGPSFATDADWGRALLAGLHQMKRYGGAKRGDRTMVDALEPALEALVATQSLDAAAQAARSGANHTATITKAGAGRSAYVPASALKGINDPGAEAVARLFEDIAHQTGR